MPARREGAALLTCGSHETTARGRAFSPATRVRPAAS